MSIRQSLEANKKMLEDQLTILQGKPNMEAKAWKLRVWITQIELKLEGIPFDHTDMGDFWRTFVS